jgi:hypothetical protein
VRQHAAAGIKQHSSQDNLAPAQELHETGG